MSFPSDIDYLFEDLPAASEAASSPAFPFEKLCGELRNNVYEHYFASEAQTVNLTEHGDIIFPSLPHASERFFFETEGYLYEALRNPTVTIAAKIRDYDPKPLFCCLEQLSRKFDVPLQSLVERVKVSFVGEANFGNILAWVRGNFENPEAVPIFSHEQTKIGGYGEMSVLEGTCSLKYFMAYYEAFKARGMIHIWRRMAIRFLGLVKDYGIEVTSLPNLTNDEELAMVIFETVARFHEIIAKGFGKDNLTRVEKGSKMTKNRVETPFNVAELMYSFEMEARRYF